METIVERFPAEQNRSTPRLLIGLALIISTFHTVTGRVSSLFSLVRLRWIRNNGKRANTRGLTHAGPLQFSSYPFTPARLVPFYRLATIVSLEYGFHGKIRSSSKAIGSSGAVCLPLQAMFGVNS